MELKEILDRVKHSFNNSAETWNKGLTVDYAIFTMEKHNTIYQWEITNIVTQDEVRLPCKLKEAQDKETQIHETLNGYQRLNIIYLRIFTVSTFLLFLFINNV